MADTVLVVDDDRQLTAFLERFLTQQGLRVRAAASRRQMEQALVQGGIDLVVLDVGLPDGDGFEIVRQLRRSSQLPVILLTARSDHFDRVIGLELGADDYLCKPFEPHELLARIRSVLRRSAATVTAPAQSPDIRSIRFPGFVLDLLERRLSGPDGATIPLTGSEFSLLKTLAENAGKVVSRGHLMQAIYGNTANVTDRAIDAHVARLRRKIEGQSQPEQLIRTVHGVGYSLAAQAVCE